MTQVTLIIGGGIAAYKSLELIRLMRARELSVVPVLTQAGSEFVTPLSIAALAGQEPHMSLFDITLEGKMGHITLSRQSDCIVVAPATADFMAKMATGRADDLASTLVLASDAPILLAPAMNVRMWEHPATQRNFATLTQDDIGFVGPEEGDMACGEFGVGRMSSPDMILEATQAIIEKRHQKSGMGPLSGRHILITSGPTHEPIDPVRYLANRSSGRQGTALAEACVALGAKVSFVTGPAEYRRPHHSAVIEVQTAQEMQKAVEEVLKSKPDAAIFAAAVADWAVAGEKNRKIKKQNGELPRLEFVENPDILAQVAQRQADRPSLVIGFAAETDNVMENARKKFHKKGCDWLVVNDVSAATGHMGGESNQVTILSDGQEEALAKGPKSEVATQLAAKIAEHFKKGA